MMKDEKPLQGPFTKAWDDLHEAVLRFIRDGLGIGALVRWLDKMLTGKGRAHGG